MKLYRVVANSQATWAGTQSDVSTIKRTLVEDGTKRKDITTEEVNVPTNKAKLVEWLSANCKGADDLVKTSDED